MRRRRSGSGTPASSIATTKKRTTVLVLEDRQKEQADAVRMTGGRLMRGRA